MAKSEYAKQFKPGAYPDQRWDESERISSIHEQDEPSKVRRRQGVAIGKQVQANPGMVPGQGSPGIKKKGRK